MSEFNLVHQLNPRFFITLFRPVGVEIDPGLGTCRAAECKFADIRTIDSFCIEATPSPLE
jgi:hypothetical protein